MSSETDLKTSIFDAVGEAYNSFIFYDRKLDKTLPSKVLVKALLDGVVTPEELGKQFQQHVEWTIEDAGKNYEDDK